MARKSVPKTEHDPKSFRDSIIEGIERLWEKHGGFALEFAEDSDAKTVAVGFQVKIDLSKSDPITSVHIGFSQKVTDEMKFTLDDPKQGTFTELVGSSKAKVGEEGDSGEASSEPQEDAPKGKKGRKS